MLYFTGQYGEKDYKLGDTISPMIIAKDFGLPEAPSGDEPLMITYVPLKVKKKAGKNVFKRSYKPVTEYEVTVAEKGIFGRLRWAQNAVPQPGGVVNFFPPHITMEGEMATFGKRDYDKFVFMSLHPKCETSPIAGNDPYFKVYDPAAEARVEAEKNRAVIELTKQIWALPEMQIRVKAAGMVVRGQMVEVTNSISTDAIRNRLFKLLNEHPDDFIKAWEYEGTVLIGLLNEARDSGKIKHEPNLRGREGWVWVKGEKAGEVLTYTTPTDDRFRALVTWASQAHNYNVVLELLTKLLPAKDAQEIFSKEAPAKTAAPSSNKWEEKVKEAISAGIISFDSATKSVVLLDDDGNIVGNPLLKDVSAKGWVSELVAKANDQSGIYVRKLLNEKLEPQAA